MGLRLSFWTFPGAPLADLLVPPSFSQNFNFLFSFMFFFFAHALFVVFDFRPSILIFFFAFGAFAMLYKIKVQIFGMPPRFSGKICFWLFLAGFKTSSCSPTSLAPFSPIFMEKVRCVFVFS